MHVSWQHWSESVWFESCNLNTTQQNCSNRNKLWFRFTVICVRQATTYPTQLFKSKVGWCLSLWHSLQMKSSFKASCARQVRLKASDFRFCFFFPIRIFQPLGAFLNNTRAATWSLLDRRWTRKTWWLVKEGLVSQYYLRQSLWYDIGGTVQLHRSTGRESIPYSVCCTVSYLQLIISYDLMLEDISWLLCGMPTPVGATTASV